MIDKIIKDEGDERNPPRHYEEYVEDLLNKVNEIVEWINTQ